MMKPNLRPLLRSTIVDYDFSICLECQWRRARAFVVAPTRSRYRHFSSEATNPEVALATSIRQRPGRRDGRQAVDTPSYSRKVSGGALPSERVRSAYACLGTPGYQSPCLGQRRPRNIARSRCWRCYWAGQLSSRRVKGMAGAAPRDCEPYTYASPTDSEDWRQRCE